MSSEVVVSNDLEYQEVPQERELETSPSRQSAIGENFKQLSRTISKATSKVARDIRWSNVNFSAGDKKILTECWGLVPAGTVCAIMGPSGSGKSSLLNVLAGRSSTSGKISISGKVTVGTMEINPVKFRKNIAYVMQDDALMATATPREALTFSANLRLPPDVARADIDALVEATLKVLGIEDCADVMIGGALIKGISGGQRKRTSVGVEIISGPELLFLDEPTSGLDSFSAFNLVELLKYLATSNCTILCTIHQPSSEVFFQFDSCIYLKDGYVFYQGPVQDMLNFFSKYDYHCPENYNPSDFAMTICQTETLDYLKEKDMLMTCPFELKSEKESLKFDEQITFEMESPFFKQLRFLIVREYRNTTRDVGALAGRFGGTIFLNLLFGLVFLNAGGEGNDTSEDFNAHFGAISMVMISGMFGAAQPTMLAFPFERPMFLREYSTGTYGIFPYVISKLVMEVPMVFMQVLVMFILVYFLIDLQGSFIYIVLATFGLSMVSTSVAVAMGAGVTDVKQVAELAPLMFVPQILFVGFFIRTSQIPVFLRWCQYLCSLKYAMNLVLLTEFDLNLDSCQSSPEARQNCIDVLDNNDIKQEDYYIYIILLFVLFLGFRMIGSAILIERAKSFY